MTYKEAREYIETNRFKTLGLSAQKEPPQEVWGFFVAPDIMYSRKEMKQYFFEEIILKKLDNEAVLLDISTNLFSFKDLLPFVVIKMNGEPLTYQLDVYLKSLELGQGLEGIGLP